MVSAWFCNMRTKQFTKEQEEEEEEGEEEEEEEEEVRLYILCLKTIINKKINMFFRFFYLMVRINWTYGGDTQ